MAESVRAVDLELETVLLLRFRQFRCDAGPVLVVPTGCTGTSGAGP
jgi:hypothetical protein